MAISITRKILSSSLDGKAFSSKTQTPLWIVIHNNAGNSASSSAGWFNNPQNGKTSAHYCVDDSEIIQCLEDNWKGHHCGGDGVHYQDKWRPSNSTDCTNNNSIGIEVSDWLGKNDEKLFKGIENAIDLTITLMKKYNIDVNHVIRHGDTQAKDCPHYIMKHNKWGYFKEQIANRTGGQIIENNSPTTGGSTGGDTSGGSSGGSSSGTVGPGQSSHLDILPNVDHRYNIGNMDELKGACLIFYPPYNTCLKDAMEERFKEWNWDRKFHYIIDPTYDVDDPANEQDDIPEINECSGTTGGTAGGTNDNDSGSNEPGTTPPSDGNENPNRVLMSSSKKVVFLGDAEAVVKFNGIDSGALIYSSSKQTVEQGITAYADTIITDQPDVIIISYGTWDAQGNNSKSFAQNYIKLIKKLKENIPNVQIYINRIFEGNPNASGVTTVNKEIMKHIPDYNSAITDVSAETQVNVIDYTGNEKDYYEDDGLRLKENFYGKWYDYIVQQVMPAVPAETSVYSLMRSGATLQNTIFLGDSLTVGLQQNVSGLRAHCTGGHAIHQGREKHMADIKKETNVENFVISYGVNDAGHKQPERFKKYYIEFINEIKTAHPNANFYVNKIFPGDLDKATNDIVKICLQNVPSHNAVLGEVCSSTGAKMLDCTTIPDLKSYYSSDGIHFIGKFYKEIWPNEMFKQMGSGGVTIPSTPGGSTGSGGTGSGDSLTWVTPEVNSPDATEDNCIVIKGGFEKVGNRLLQLYGLEDNDRVTYINRSLFKNHPEKHTIMIACCIPSYEELPQDYEKVEKNIINSLSKILWANGLNTKDLWREFDLNRAPSPATYLDRDRWKKLLTEIDKLVEWRNTKFGVVSKTYEKYVAAIPEPVIGGSSDGSTPSTQPGGSVDIGGISDTAQAVWTFFTGKGFTKECTAGIMGNLQQESGMNPNSHQSGGGKGRGICQWSYGEDRFKNLQAHAASKGKEWTDLQCQLEFLDMELQGKDVTTLNNLKKFVGGYEQFKKMTDINQACKVFEDSFERAGKPMMEKRYAYAKSFYDKFAGSSGGTSPAAYVRTNPNAKAPSGTLSWPCPSTKSISSKFGPRKAPTAGASTNHKGIDIPCPSGSSIIAAAAGKVVVAKSGYNGGRGTYMVVDHGNGLGTLYQHLSSCGKSVGDSVSNGDEIAKSGATGIGTGAHLHFEVHENFSGTKGTPVNPENYVSPGTASGSIEGSNNGGSSGDSGSSGSNGGSSGSSGESGEVSGPLVNSPSGKIENPGPTEDENSMGGLEHDDWGGKTTYTVAEPADETAKKPEIANVMTGEEYKEFCERFFVSYEFGEDGTVEPKVNFRKYWELIDIYCADIEPYDKGVVSLEDSAITPNDRISALSKKFTTSNENTFHFNVVESGPGSKGHCVKAADELNVIAVPEDLTVEPIYPDLVIPPQYSTTDYDDMSKNSIPLTIINEIIDTVKDAFTKQFDFDYDLLKDKTKKTAEHLGPVNFLDPYPTDDKIQELESHYPKVFIDEIESQLYSCNHPGCPIGQPMAKNFAMLQDAIMNQSKRTEKRLVRLENLLSTIMRNQARLGSRVNINCVYYGGQSTFGKYKCIRCMHDDRIHDGAIVTIDQCLNCTRYEPILGQIYQILDESGLNGSIILDDMQMSYSTLEDFKRINTVEERSPKYEYVDAKEEDNCTKPEKTREEIWQTANYNIYKEQNKDKNLEEKDEEENKKEENKGFLEGIVDSVVDFVTGDNKDKDNENKENNENKEQNKAATEEPETNYIFRMDWRETFFNQQEPDTKEYPAEGIIARYKKEDIDLDYEEEIKNLDPETDKDAIEDLQNLIKIANNNWVDTREKADTIQVNKYSSEKFYFDGFAEMKAAVSGGSSSGGSDSSGGSSSPGTSLGGSECRNKIVEMAKQIVADYDAGKAKYSQSPRTVDYTKPQSSGGKVCYDCTSFVSCCYMHAGLKSMYSKSCSGGTLVAEIVNNGGEMWLCNESGLSKAKPGDVIVRATKTLTESDMGTKVGSEHAMIYIGDGKYSHSSSPTYGINTKELGSKLTDKKHFFCRPKDLIDADAKAASSSGGVESGDITTKEKENESKDNSSGATPAMVRAFSLARTNVTKQSERQVIGTVIGQIDGMSYVAKVPGAVCSSYYGGTSNASGLGLENGKTCASHNLPYGTKLYVPSLKEKLGGNGIVTVTDTGGPTFDFDFYTSKSIGKVNADVYILEWGNKKIAPSYTWALNFYNDDQWNNLKSAWRRYKEMNGKLITFLKFSPEDTNIKNHKRY